ncbi:MAG TPA: MFS transporter [Chloroflexia bacterium]|nr:MFS transporter [Chloroflexia bacterium]
MTARKSYVALTMATLAFAASFAAWSLLAPLATQLQKQYHIGDFEISVLLAIPVILGSLARIPMGFLTDRFGGRKVMSALLLFCVIPCLGMTTAASFEAFAFWGFLLGMAGSSFAVGVPFVSRFFGPEKQGLVVGVFGMGNIGTAIAARVAPEVSKANGWQSAFVLFGVVVLVTAIAFFFLAGDEKRPATSTSMSQRLEILKRERLTWLFSLFYFLTFGGFVAFGLYLPKLLVDLFGLDKVDAANRAAVFVLVATLARPVGGWLSDKISATKVLTAVFAIVPAMAVVLAFQPDIVILTVAFLVIAAMLGLGNGAVFKLVPQYYSKEAGTVTGLVGAAGGLGGFFPPLVMGAFKTALGSYALGYVLLAGVAVVCLVLNLAILGKRNKHQKVQSGGNDRTLNAA